jgi:hypothetical protein
MECTENVKILPLGGTLVIRLAPHLPRRLVEHPAGYQVRRVRSAGEIKWRGRLVFLSEALIGEPVGLQEIANDRWRIAFGPVPVALYHTTTRQFARL